MKIKDLLVLSKVEGPKVDRPKKKYPHVGHRARLRKRFLQSRFDGFLDYEIIELLFSLGGQVKDCKPMAKEAIKEFDGLRGVLEASTEDLQKINGIGPSSAFGIKLFQAISERYAKEKITKKDFFDSPDTVAKYLQKSIGLKKKEYFVMLYLDSRNNLIKNDVSVGTINASLVYPREVFKNAIQSNAAQVIIAHNHPSGDLEPSPEDIKVTLEIIEAGRILGIEVLDHLIVTKSEFLSFKQKGLVFN